MKYRGSGMVGGRVLNQFSMDEHNDNLRIATTIGGPPWRKHNAVSVLADHPIFLPRIGLLDGIAPNEDIRSARFDGDIGYIVTFKKTDPLYVIDFSDPTAPAIKGELKIPGFSTYMHLMDDTHLLTMGYDAQDEGNFAWFTGIRLQIIDVTDLTDPKLLHKEIIGTRGSTSDAATNHLAFNYYPKRDLLALPMVICEGEDIFDSLMTFSGLLVYDTTVDAGFEQLGGIPHQEKETEENNWGECRNWWTDPNSKVKRSIFMEDFVYSIALDRIDVSHLDDLEHAIASVDLID
jgi:uncharacterized secreted protein with C-terminal beta-propeller domain